MNQIQSVVKTIYEQMIEEEKTKGTLFEVERKRQNRRLK